MKIDGKSIAEEVKNGLKKQVVALLKKKITPHLAVILIGNDPSSQVYVQQKQKIGTELGIKVLIYNLETTNSPKDTPGVTGTGSPGVERSNKDIFLSKKLSVLGRKLNADPSVHGIIIQRPLPIEIEKEELDRLVAPSKDVDSFHPNSPFTPPIALAVLKILKWVYKSDKENKDTTGEVLRSDSPGVEGFNKKLLNWLRKKQILIIGRGETGGKPIAETFKKMGVRFTVAHSQTTNLKELCLKADIIISCVGKPNIVRRENIGPETVLIGVGLHEKNGKLKPDYDQEEVADKVAYYTPVPGGVGPVNVACLFENLLNTFVSRNLGSWRR